MKTKRIIAILISFMMIFCGTSSIVFAAPNTEDSFASAEEMVSAAEDKEDAVATDEETTETVAEETGSETEKAADEEATAAEETTTDEIDIVKTNSPVEASQEVPAEDNEKYYTVDLNTGEVTKSNHKKLKNGFKKLYGKDFSKAGIKGKSKKEKHKRIEQMTEDNELYSVDSIEDNTAEICANYASCRLIVIDTTDIETFGAISGVNYRGKYILKYQDEETTAKAHASLCEKYGSDHVLVDLPVKVQEDSQTSAEWNYSLMGYPTVTEPEETFSRTITVAVLDTGINADHEVFNGKTIIKGYDFVSLDEDPSDDNGHGTNVAGIIAGATGTNVEILVIKTLDVDGAGYTSDVELGLDYAEDRGADLANMSLGLPLVASGGVTVKQKLKLYNSYLNEFSGPIIVASGNNGGDISSLNYWPAVSDRTISVGSVDKTFARASSSNYGKQLDFTAPGAYIKLANYVTTSGYCRKSGTSFAAPHVAAVAAILMAKDSSLQTNEQVMKKLIGISVDLGDEGFDEEYGNGVPVLENTKWIKAFKVASIPVDQRIYNGNAIEPKLTVTRGDKTLEKGTDYTVEYSNNKDVGMAKATITGINDYFGTKEVNFKVAAMGTTIKKLTKGSGAITVKWVIQKNTMSQSRVTGYQIQVATDSAFTKNAKKVTKTKYTSTSKRITKLKKKKKYYVRVRTYKTVKGTKFYSKWSPVKTIKTK